MRWFDIWEENDDDREAWKEYINDSCCFPVKYKTKRDILQYFSKNNKVKPLS